MTGACGYGRRVEITVRPATRDDVGALHRLRVEAEDWLAARGIEQWGHGEVTRDDVRAQVVDGQWHVGQTDDGEVAGGLRLLWGDEQIWQADHAFAAYVHGLVVGRRFARLGIGERLLAWVHEQARAARAPTVRLDCVEGNAALRSYYARLGFREVGRRDFDGPWFAAVLLERPVPAPDLADDLRLALDVSDRAAHLASAHFEAGVAATPKADGSPVTEADRAVERLHREALSQTRPGDALLGEELGRVGESERVWVLDPIDGTTFFVRGDPNWRVHVALQVRGTTEVAVVTSPALRRCWWATRGGGAFESAWPRADGEARRLEVTTTSALDGAVLDALGDPTKARLPAGTGRPPATPLPLVGLVHGEVDAVLAEGY
ncbi:MAG: GNAT family N-acetyltransferase, partial [Actinobacteria bacterium]|nr:GNAT family N-acetyltransferase [Actinomycetota bacterium]